MNEIENIDYIICPYCNKHLKKMTNTHIKLCCSKYGIFTVKQFKEKHGFYACKKSINKLSCNTRKQWKKNYKNKCNQVKAGVIKSYKNGRISWCLGKTKKTHPNLASKHKGQKLEQIVGPEKAKQLKKNISESKKGTHLSEEHKECIRLSNIRRIAEGRFMPYTDTLPHRLLREAMQKNNLWEGFENEVPMKYCCIDIADKNRKIAIFVDGGYWHGDTRFYKTFSDRQKQRYMIDKVHNEYLKSQGWIVLRFWEYDIKNNIDECIKKINSVISNK